MKKLLGTTALVAVALTTAPAVAADKINLNVGGYFVGGIAAIFDSDANGGISRATGLANPGFAGVDERTIRFARESEIHFAGSTTLDNGIEVGVRFELETGEANTTDVMDEAYIWVRGAFGEFQFGAQDGVGDQMPIVAPSPFLETFANDTDLDPLGSDIFVNTALFTAAFVPGSNTFNPQGSGTDQIINTVVDFSGDDEKIIYFTPRLAGFQIGLSFAPETEELSGDESTGDPFKGLDLWHNVFEAGLTWEHSFNGLDVGLSAVYLQTAGRTAFGRTPDLVDYAFGAEIAYAGFTVGGAYAEKESYGHVDATTGNLLSEAEHWDVGATYATGPFTFGIEYAAAGRDELNGFTGALNSAGVLTGAGLDEIDLEAYVGGVSYALGGGANVSLGYKHAKDNVAKREGSALFTEFGVKF